MKKSFLKIILFLSLFGLSLEASPWAYARQAVRIGLGSGIVGLWLVPAHSAYVGKKACEAEEVVPELTNEEVDLLTAQCNKPVSYLHRIKRFIGLEVTKDNSDLLRELERIKKDIKLVTFCKDAAAKMGGKPEEVKLVELKGFLRGVSPGVATTFMGQKLVLLNLEAARKLDEERAKFLVGHEVAHLYQPWRSKIMWGMIFAGSAGLMWSAAKKPAPSTVRFLGRVALRNPVGFIAFFVLNTPIHRYYEKDADVRSAETLKVAQGGVDFFEKIVAQQLRLREEVLRDRDLPLYKKIIFSAMIAKNGNSRIDIIHPPVTWRIAYLKRIAKEQGE